MKPELVALAIVLFFGPLAYVLWTWWRVRAADRLRAERREQLRQWLDREHPVYHRGDLVGTVRIDAYSRCVLIVYPDIVVGLNTLASWPRWEAQWRNPFTGKLHMGFDGEPNNAIRQCVEKMMAEIK